MAYQTVHIDGTGELRPMDLDQQQAHGLTCAICNDPTIPSPLVQIGKLAGAPESEIKVHQSCAP